MGVAAQFLAIGSGQFGGLAGSQGPAIGDEVGDGDVDFVPHGGDDRNLRVEDGLGQNLGIERRQVFAAATAASEDNHIDRLPFSAGGQRGRRQAANGQPRQHPGHVFGRTGP